LFLDEFLVSSVEHESVLLVEIHRVLLQILLHVLQLVLGQNGRRPVSPVQLTELVHRALLENLFLEVSVPVR